MIARDNNKDTEIAVSGGTSGLVRVTEETAKWVAPRPLTFSEFLDRFGEDDDVELIDGAAVEKMAAQLDHERLFVWLSTILNYYVKSRHLGIVLGSRTAVEITNFRGRLPDLLFVRRENEPIVQQRAIFGTPDFVAEFVSPNDRPSDILALETDYRTIGVPEMWFIDQGRRQVRALRRQGDGSYQESEHENGVIAAAQVDGFALEVGWFWADPRPDEPTVIAGLLGQGP